MAGARCAKCDAPIERGTHCAACAGNASTMIAAVPTTAGAPAAKARKQADPLIGAEVIGQYVIRSQLGKGGMGTVYLADQQSVGRRAVIKVLHPKMSRDPGIQARFETEARAASQLNHPNIVTIYNYGAMTDGTLFLAMEHLDGQTLADANAKRRMPLPRVVNIVCQIADALGEAHRRGVVHRDVKPTNVMLVKRGETDDFVKVLDFGIAQIEGTRVTATGDICGTPTYMSPEQIRSKPVDGRSDLYSLGCMLFELVTGDVPYSGGNTLGLAYMHVHEAPPRASERAPKAGISSALDAFMIRALAKEPGDRPRNAAAFRDELRAAMSAAPVVAVPRTDSKPSAKPETQPKAAKPRADTKPPVKTQPRMRGSNALQRTLVGFTDLARRGFRRRKPLGQRLRSRIRAWRGRSRSQRRLISIAIVSLLAISLVGVGAYFVTHPSKAREAAAPAIPAAKPPPPPPAKRPGKRTGTRP